MGRVVKFESPWKRPQARKRRGVPFTVWLALSATAAATVGYTGFELPQAVGSDAALVSRASVVDGDTIELRGERVRLNGVDAPEAKQLCQDAKGKSYRCGAASAKALAELLAASSPTRCEFVERDRYGRFVGDCFRADGRSVSAVLVRSGWAMDYTRYSKGAYASEQATANAERAGIWQGAFQPPWEWRAEQRDDAAAASSAPQATGSSSAGCRIKGNVSGKGERIYHLPG